MAWMQRGMSGRLLFDDDVDDCRKRAGAALLADGAMAPLQAALREPSLVVFEAAKLSDPLLPILVQVGLVRPGDSCWMVVREPVLSAFRSHLASGIEIHPSEPFATVHGDESTLLHQAERRAFSPVGVGHFSEDLVAHRLISKAAKDGFELNQTPLEIGGAADLDEPIAALDDVEALHRSALLGGGMSLQLQCRDAGQQLFDRAERRRILLVSEPVDRLFSDTGVPGQVGNVDPLEGLGQLCAGDHVRNGKTFLSNCASFILDKPVRGDSENHLMSYPRAILAANLRRMIDSEEMSVRAWATERGLDVRMIDRLTKGQHAVTLDKLDEVAAAIGLKPWMLLIEDLDPANPPDAPISEADREMLTKLRRLLGP